MKFLLAFPFLFVANLSFAQYYYTDIIVMKQSSEQYWSLLKAKVKKVQGFAYDPFGVQAKDFQTDKSISPDGQTVMTLSVLPNQPSLKLVNEYQDGKLFRSTSTNIKEETSVETITRYSYDQNGNLESISTNTTDTFVTHTVNNEVHLWYYGAANFPLSMTRIRNNTDTMKVVFEKDEKGMLALEKWSKGKEVFNTYYYYYDDNGNLTDVVRFRPESQKLLPDMVYEYDKSGRIVKMIQSIKGGTSHLTWKYTYNKDGLREQELCYDAKNRPQGKVEYDYIK